MNFKKPLYLILGSGGVRGMAHIGVIEALETRGIVPDAVIGCSMGALVGAYYAAGMSSASMKMLAHRFVGGSMRNLIDPVIPVRGLIRGRKIRRFLKKTLPVRDFDQLKKQLIVSALDIQRGRLHLFEHGSVVNAVMASIAIPGVFPPLDHKGNYFVDGGVVSPVPTSVAFDRGAASIIAVDVCPWVEFEQDSAIDDDESERGEEESEFAAPMLFDPFFGGKNPSGNSPLWERLFGQARDWSDRFIAQIRHWRLEQRLSASPHIIQTLMRSMMIMQREMGDMHMRLYPPTVLVSPELRGVRAFDFDKMDKCIELGRQAADEALDNYAAKFAESLNPPAS